jgi:low temperature requirement protein LtrA
LAERCRHVFIVALGELIVVSGLALSGAGFASGRTAAFVVSIATTAALLRIYIHRAGDVLSAAFTTAGLPDRFGRWATLSTLRCLCEPARDATRFSWLPRSRTTTAAI